MTYLLVGEPTLLTYTPPNATTQRLGRREGSLHNGGLGGVTVRTGNTYKLSNTNPGKWVTDGGRIISTPDQNPPPWTPSVHALTRVD